MACKASRVSTVLGDKTLRGPPLAFSLGFLAIASPKGSRAVGGRFKLLVVSSATVALAWLATFAQFSFFFAFNWWVYNRPEPRHLCCPCDVQPLKDLGVKV